MNRLPRYTTKEIRARIISYLHGHKQGTTSEIARFIQTAMPDIDSIQVYTQLRRLAEYGDVRQLDAGPGSAVRWTLAEEESDESSVRDDDELTRAIKLHEQNKEAIEQAIMRAGGDFVNHTEMTVDDFLVTLARNNISITATWEGE